MTAAGFTAIAPLILLGAGAVVVMLAAAFARFHALAAVLTLATLGAAGASLKYTLAAGGPVGLLLMADGYAVFFSGLMLAASAAVVLFAHGYLAKRNEQREEFYLLLLLSTLGAVVLAMANHLAALFLGLELLSLGLYAMVGYFRQTEGNIEAALKYIILAGAASAVLLFGMALAYAGTGGMRFDALRGQLDHPGGLVFAGTVLILAGAAFKLALAPFHMWTPDVYCGASAPAAAFVATVSKGGVLAAFMRFLDGGAALENGTPFFALIALLAVASMVAGNLLALLTGSLKKLLAYSSVAHFGYMLVALLAGGALGVEAVGYYLAAYFPALLMAFGGVAAVSGDGIDPDQIDDYRGLFRQRPVVAAAIAASMFSLAGIPLTGGFVGKFYVLAAGAGAALWGLVLVLVITSVIGLYYYLRVVVALVQVPAEDTAVTLAEPARLAVLGLALLTITLIVLGVAPALLGGWLETAAML